MKTRYILFSAVLFLIVLTLPSLTAIERTPPESPELINITMPLMETAKMHTLEVLDAMPEEDFGYKPTDVNKTFGSQMVHIGYSLHYFSEAMLKGNRINYQEPDASGLSKAQIREIVENGFDDIMASMAELTEEDLQTDLPFGPNKTITRGQAVIFAHDHVTNHRAKANLYLRLNDIQPPNYKFL